MSSHFYRAFEERYRGSRELIKERLRAYAPFIDELAARYPGARAIDLGCGRGEWLELMGEAGFAANGVDLDEGMLAACRERGLQVETADALVALRALPDASVALVSAFHLVEHLPFEVAQDLIAQAQRVLLPAGLLIMETPNPENLIVGTSNFYLDPSHLKPIPPLLLDFMVSFAGFARNAVVRLQGQTSDSEERLTLTNLLEGVSYDYAVVAQHSGMPEDLAPFDRAFAATYGVALDVMAQRYDQSQARHAERLEQALLNRPALDEALSHLQGAVTALDDQAGAVSVAIAELDRGMTGLDHQALRQSEALASLSDGFQHFASQADQRLLGLEASTGWLNEMAQLIDVLMTAQAQAAELAQRVAALEAFKAETLLHASTASAAAPNASGAPAIERRSGVEERRAGRVNPLEGRLFDAMNDAMQARRQAADNELRAQLEEKESRNLRVLAQQNQARVAHLEQYLAAVMASTSWRMTAPVRLAGYWAKRVYRALREGRLHKALARRTGAVVMPLRHEGGGWLGVLARRARQKESLRRLLLPVLARFPRLNAHLSNAIGNPYAVHVGRPAGDISHPDWPGPLPAEYINMSPSSRKVLLDLARAGQTTPEP